MNCPINCATHVILFMRLIHVHYLSVSFKAWTFEHATYLHMSFRLQSLSDCWTFKHLYCLSVVHWWHGYECQKQIYKLPQGQKIWLKGKGCCTVVKFGYTKNCENGPQGPGLGRDFALNSLPAVGAMWQMWSQATAGRGIALSFSMWVHTGLKNSI